MNEIGLIQLPEPIQLSATIQPVKLSENCFDVYKSGVDVYAAGVGQTHPDQRYVDFDGLLRQAAFSTISRYYYASYLDEVANLSLKSIIVTEPLEESGLGGGDSGGPLFFQDDHTLIGINRGTLSVDDDHIQTFTRVAYFYGWIANKTGLLLPKCKDNAPTLA